jgi:hypothetical protein
VPFGRLARLHSTYRERVLHDRAVTRTGYRTSYEPGKLVPEAEEKRDPRSLLLREFGDWTETCLNLSQSFLISRVTSKLVGCCLMSGRVVPVGTAVHIKYIQTCT